MLRIQFYPGSKKMRDLSRAVRAVDRRGCTLLALRFASSPLSVAASLRLSSVFLDNFTAGAAPRAHETIRLIRKDHKPRRESREDRDPPRSGEKPPEEARSISRHSA